MHPISATEHEEFITARGSASFLQTPAWGAVKTEWRSESLGWFDGSTLVGAGLVLYRQVPRLRRYLAYLPEGPLIDWADEDLSVWLDPMVAHLRAHRAFGIRIGPPVVTRRWTADQIKQGIADPEIDRLEQLPPTERSAAGARLIVALHDAGWQRQGGTGGFAAGQPQFNFVLPLRTEAGPRTEAEVLAGMNQLWRRNIKKAAKSGVVVTRGERTDLAAFHALYTHTAERDRFTPRPLRYFEAMYDALTAADPDRLTVWLARHEQDLVAATISIRVGGHAWYSYGASSTTKREVRGSNAIQWAMIRAALDAGAEVYDLRGITDTLDAEDPHVGLIQFKVGTGGEAVEYAGEWDLPVSPLLYRAFQFYLARRR